MSATAERTPVGRATWHRRAGLIPTAYLAAIVPVSLLHSIFAQALVAQGRWLLIHLLLLGAVTNAIVVWSAHFTAAILRVRTPASRRGEVLRLAFLNAGILGVLLGGTAGPPWLGVAAATVVFGAIAAHMGVLAVWLRHALPARFAVTVRYYLVGAFALLAGIPAGAWMLLLDDDQRPRLLLFHAHVNVLGWVTLTVLGTLLTLWPTVLRTRMVEGAARAATRALRLCEVGLILIAAGALLWWPFVVTAGLGLFAAALGLVAVPTVATARQSRPASFSAWSIAAGLGWLAIALVWDAVGLLQAPNAAAAADRFDTILVPFGVGFVAQVLIGALSYLLPMALGGGPARVRERTARFDAQWPQRVVMANLALAIYLLPEPPVVRIGAFSLIVVALVQFLVIAARVLLSRTR